MLSNEKIQRNVCFLYLLHNLFSSILLNTFFTEIIFLFIVRFNTDHINFNFIIISGLQFFDYLYTTTIFIKSNFVIVLKKLKKKYQLKFFLILKTYNCGIWFSSPGTFIYNRSYHLSIIIPFTKVTSQLSCLPRFQPNVSILVVFFIPIVTKHTGGLKCARHRWYEYL